MIDWAAEFREIGKTYRHSLFQGRSITAVDRVSLAVPRGCVFGLLGPNRAGKTTLVKILLSICHPTAGSFKRLGRPSSCRQTLSDVGYMHECQAFPRYLSAEELLRYYAALGLVSAAEVRRRIPVLLDEVGLADRRREPIATFSKGMVQRLALAQALMNDPQLLVLDEPTEGMDLLARHLLHDVVRRRRERGKTVLLVSHSLADVELLCDRVAVLRQGQLAFEGTLGELMAEGDSGDLEEALEPLYCRGAT